MSLLGLASLLVEETKTQIYTKALAVAEFVGLPVSSWQAGDPTRSLYHLLSEILSTLEGVVAQYVAAGFLDYAEGEWLILLAKQVFDVDAIEATYATTTVTLTNTGGGLFEDITAGDLTFKNTATGKTYRNTNATPATLSPGPGTTLDLEVTADEAGTASNAGATEIDDLVTVLLGVTVSNATAATALDEESAPALRQRCRDKLGSLSPNGPKNAYDYVAKTPALAGTSAVTRTRAVEDSDTGDVTLYLAGASGAVLEADRALVEAAVILWATPLCITPTVVSATNVAVPVTYQLWLYESAGVTEAEAEAAVALALGAMFAVRPIGGDVITTPPGALYQTLLESTIRGTYPSTAFRVAVSAPAADVELAISEVATLGAITPTITFVSDP